MTGRQCVPTGIEGHVIYGQPDTDHQVVYNVIGDGNVAVPTAFFKIVVDTTTIRRILKSWHSSFRTRARRGTATVSL